MFIIYFSVLISEIEGIVVPNTYAYKISKKSTRVNWIDIRLQDSTQQALKLNFHLKTCNKYNIFSLYFLI